MTKEERYAKMIEYIRRTIPLSDMVGRMVMLAFLKDSIDREEKNEQDS